MAVTIRTLTLDVSERRRVQTVSAKQHDKESRYLNIKVTDNGCPVKIESAAVVTVNARRSDGEAKAFAGQVDDDSTITVLLNSWMLELDGIVSCDVSVVDAQGRKLSTFDFAVEVERTNYSGDDISEDENYDILVTLITGISDIKKDEAKRAAAESQRTENETARETAEDIRVSNETARVSNETDRKSTETVRNKAEKSRIDAETTRIGAEVARAEAETTRISAESARVSSEAERAAAEIIREQNTAKCVEATERCELVTESVLTKFTTLADVQRVVRLGYHDDLLPVGDQITVNRVENVTAGVGESTGITAAGVNPQKFIEKTGEARNGQYSFTFDGSVWRKEDNAVIALSDYGISVSGTPASGDRVIITEKAKELVFDILDHDKHTPQNPGLLHSLALGLHNVFTHGTIPFCASQLMYYTEGGLPAGNYKFTLDHAVYGGGTQYDGTYMFTLTQAIPADGGFRHTNPIGGWKNSYAQSDVIGNYITTYGARPQRTEVEKNVAV